MSIEIGDMFGKLTVIDFSPNPHRGVKYKCQCECKSIRVFSKSALEKGNNQSCGCLLRVHGLAGSRIHNAWSNMKRRCNDPSNKSYANYGGRGISYDERWEQFENFYVDMKDSYSDDLTLDRKDVDGNYTKDNCRWSDMVTQSNNRRTNHLVEYNDETLTIAEISRKYNVDRTLIAGRLHKGWDIERVLTEEPRELITYNGETKRVVEFANERGMSYHQLKKRLMRGWTIERALNQPLRERNSN